jgi:ubiquinone/menaquinone biosynthesis C-methylase UbiE
VKLSLKLLEGITSRLRQGHEPHWEYYNRLRVVSEAIKQLELPHPKVLDVGGATGNNLLVKFHISDVTTLDISSRADIVSSADRIPLADNSYDMVTCIDTIEHIARESRGQVVREIVRVASRAAFLVAPVNSEDNNRAEQLVLKYKRNRFVREHQAYGLVDFDEIESILEDLQRNQSIKSFNKRAIDDLLNWVTMMTRCNIFRQNQIYREAYFLENRFCPRRIMLSIYIR